MQRSARIEIIKRNTRVKAENRGLAKNERIKWKLWKLQKQQITRQESEYITDERRHRREDWLAGPLAPNRNIGKIKGAYGALENISANLIPVPGHKKDTPTRLGFHEIKNDGTVASGKAFKGKTIIGNVIENDRVVVVEGPPHIKGIVGTVKAIGMETQSVSIKDLNVMDVMTTEVQKVYANTDGKGAGLFETQEVAIPMKNVRLVCDIEDPRTREKKAVIIRHVHADGPYTIQSPFTTWPSHTRYATGTGHLTPDGKDIRLDWPEEIPGEVPRRLDDDTTSSVVQAKTWIPTIDNSPIGYATEIVQPKKGHASEAPEGRYTAGIPPPESKVRFSAQRLGLHGFVNWAKLDQRQEKIANGIMAELRGNGRVFKDDPTVYIKQQIMHDARSIWWQNREVLSPVAEAAKKIAEEKQRRREAQLSQQARGDMGSVVDSELVEALQATALKDRYERPDRRFAKHLAKKKSSKPADPLLDGKSTDLRYERSQQQLL